MKVANPPEVATSIFGLMLLKYNIRYDPYSLLRLPRFAVYYGTIAGFSGVASNALWGATGDSG
jgi:hypothetical protein